MSPKSKDKIKDLPLLGPLTKLTNKKEKDGQFTNRDRQALDMHDKDERQLKLKNKGRGRKGDHYKQIDEEDEEHKQGDELSHAVIPEE